MWGWCWLGIKQLCHFRHVLAIFAGPVPLGTKLSVMEKKGLWLPNYWWQKATTLKRPLVSAFSRLRVGVACLDNCLGYSPPASLRGNCVSYGLTDILLDSTADTWVGWWWVLAALTAVRVTALLSANLNPNVSCKDRKTFSLFSPTYPAKARTKTRQKQLSNWHGN